MATSLSVADCQVNTVTSHTVFLLAGSGLFGLVALLSMLIAHVIFGAVIGAVYGWGKGVV